MIGYANVEDDIMYKHLDIYLNKYLSIDDRIKEAASKLKGTFLSLVNSGIYEVGLNPITYKHIYKKAKHYIYLQQKRNKVVFTTTIIR